MEGFWPVYKYYFAFPVSVEMLWTLDFVLLASAGNGAGNHCLHRFIRGFYFYPSFPLQLQEQEPPSQTPSPRTACSTAAPAVGGAESPGE